MSTQQNSSEDNSTTYSDEEGDYRIADFWLVPPLAHWPGDGVVLLAGPPTTDQLTALFSTPHRVLLCTLQLSLVVLVSRLPRPYLRLDTSRFPCCATTAFNGKNEGYTLKEPWKYSHLILSFFLSFWMILLRFTSFDQCTVSSRSNT